MRVVTSPLHLIFTKLLLNLVSGCKVHKVCLQVVYIVRDPGQDSLEFGSKESEILSCVMGIPCVVTWLISGELIKMTNIFGWYGRSLILINCTEGSQLISNDGDSLYIDRTRCSSEWRALIFLVLRLIDPHRKHFIHNLQSLFLK